MDQQPLYLSNASSCPPSILAHYSHFPVFHIGQYLLACAKAIWPQCVSGELSGVDHAANLNCEPSPRILLHIDDV